MNYDKERPILTTSQVNRLSSLELQTFTCFNTFVTGDPAGVDPQEPSRLNHEAVMIYEDSKGKQSIDQERELDVLKAKFAGFHEARALPTGTVKVRLLSLRDGLVHVAHPFVEGGPTEFFSRLEGFAGDFRRMPV